MNVKLVAVRNGNVVGTVLPVNPSGGGSPADPNRRLFETEPDVIDRRGDLNAAAYFVLENADWIGDKNDNGGIYGVTYRLEVDQGVEVAG